MGAGGGGPFLLSNCVSGLASGFLEVLLMLPILIPPKHFFPEGINEVLIEAACDEALRKSSHCASKEFMLTF